MGLTNVLGNLLSLVCPSSPTPPHGVDEDMWSGPDDMWPDIPDPATIAPNANESDLIVTAQFGLQMPNGTIVWNVWNDPPLFIPFDNPLDRLRMVANLQKTADDLGFEHDEFLSCYGWATRNQIASVVYEDTGIHPLTDPVACGVTQEHLNGAATDDRPEDQ